MCSQTDLRLLHPGENRYSIHCHVGTVHISHPHVLRGNTTTITAVWWAVAYALFCWRGARDKYGSRAGGT